MTTPGITTPTAPSPTQPISTEGVSTEGVSTGSISGVSGNTAPTLISGGTITDEGSSVVSLNEGMTEPLLSDAQMAQITELLVEAQGLPDAVAEALANGELTIEELVEGLIAELPGEMEAIAAVLSETLPLAQDLKTAKDNLANYSDSGGNGVDDATGMTYEELEAAVATAETALADNLESLASELQAYNDSLDSGEEASPEGFNILAMIFALMAEDVEADIAFRQTMHSAAASYRTAAASAGRAAAASQREAGSHAFAGALGSGIGAIAGGSVQLRGAANARTEISTPNTANAANVGGSGVTLQATSLNSGGASATRARSNASADLQPAGNNVAGSNVAGNNAAPNAGDNNVNAAQRNADGVDANNEVGGDQAGAVADVAENADVADNANVVDNANNANNANEANNANRGSDDSDAASSGQNVGVANREGAGAAGSSGGEELSNRQNIMAQYHMNVASARGQIITGTGAMYNGAFEFAKANAEADVTESQTEQATQQSLEGEAMNIAQSKTSEGTMQRMNDLVSRAYNIITEAL